MQLIAAGDPLWDAAYSALPPESREPYFHACWSAASGAWEHADPEAILHRPSVDKTFLYPFLNHPLPFAGTGHHDIQTPYGYGGPLFAGDWSASEKIATLTALAGTLRARGAIAEFIRCHPDLIDPEDLAAAGYTTFQVRTNVECALKSAEDFTQAWHSAARRNLRKAIASGLSWRVSEDGNAEDLKAFHRLYLATADRLAMGAHYRFDRAYPQGILTTPVARLIIVEAPGAPALSPIPIAAAIVLLSDHRAYYHLGASDFAFQQLRPNDFLYYAMASLAQRHGCAKIAWGGGTTNDPEDSLLRFKSHFGAIRRPVYCAGRILNAEAFAHQQSQWRAAHPDRSAKMFLGYRA